MTRTGVALLEPTPLAQGLERREDGFGELALELDEGARIAVAHEPPASTVLTGAYDERAVELAREGGQHPGLDMRSDPGGKLGMEVGVERGDLFLHMVHEFGLAVGQQKEGIVRMGVHP